MTQNDLTEKLTMAKELTPLPDDTPEYPPKGTPNECLGICIDGDLNMEVLGHTGRYFHGQFVEAGLKPEESGMPSCPIIGYFVFENGEVWSHKDWETRVVDDYGIDGVYREPTLQDFEKFDVEPPRFAIDLQSQLVESQKLNTELKDLAQTLICLVDATKWEGEELWINAARDFVRLVTEGKDNDTE